MDVNSDRFDKETEVNDALNDESVSTNHDRWDNHDNNPGDPAGYVRSDGEIVYHNPTRMPCSVNFDKWFKTCSLGRRASIAVN